MHAKSKSENEKKIEAGEAWANEEKVKELGFAMVSQKIEITS